MVRDGPRKALVELGRPPPSSSSIAGIEAALTSARWRDLQSREPV
jgi:hypothetical protein